MLPLLPRGLSPKGLDIIFPSRFTLSGEEGEVKGGRKVDLRSLLEDPSLNEDNENWDALDKEEVEAMRQISSAYNVKSLGKVDVEMYPRFVIKDFGTGPKAVDRLLKVLLPAAQAVFQKQEEEKDNARAAANLRKK